MLPLNRIRNAVTATAAAIALLALSGCGNVQLEGKLFDWMGVSGSALDAKNRDPKMAARAPLVVPPKLTRLPEPGSGKSKAEAEIAALNDPELRKKAEAEERERLHLAYCRGEKQWKERALDSDYSGNRSPFGPCPGLLSGITDKLTK